jgi:hypothetical protein
VIRRVTLDEMLSRASLSELGYTISRVDQRLRLELKPGRTARAVNETMGHAPSMLIEYCEDLDAQPPRVLLMHDFGPDDMEVFRAVIEQLSIGEPGYRRRVALGPGCRPNGWPRDQRRGVEIEHGEVAGSLVNTGLEAHYVVSIGHNPFKGL